MTTYDIFSLIIDILSLVSTILISIIIYKLENKRQKQIEEQQEKERLRDLEHEAEIFIIKNGDEIDFLPLCVFANSICGTKKHKRAIYNNFNICSDELKKVILRKRKIYISELKNKNWFSDCNEKFIEEIKKRNLGKNLYYDDAKYVTYCMAHFGSKQLPEINSEFELIFYNIQNGKIEPKEILTCSLCSYINHYLHFVEDIKNYDNYKNIELTSPCDYVYEIAVSEENDIYCYWCAELMRYLCSFLRDEERNTSFFRNSYSQAIEIVPEYFEDLYYCAIYELYLTFGK